MLRLLVLRHAKATPHDDAHDRERPLVPKGRHNAERVGRAMRMRDLVPALVLCSPAARTFETWQAVASELGGAPVLELRDELYDAPAGAILGCVQAVQKSVSPVLYIGHNPGLEQFARLMVRAPETAEERSRSKKLAKDFATAALAVIDFRAVSWADVAPGEGILADYFAPADLD